MNREGQRHLGLEILPRVLWVVMFISLFVGQRVLDRPVSLTVNTGLLIAGACLTVIGAAGWLFVAWFMRRAFFGRQLVTSGPFACVRHPMYVGVYVMLLGLGLSLGTWPWFAIMAAFAPVWWLEMLVEERHMVRVYGRPYEIYRQRTGMIFPKFMPWNRTRSERRPETGLGLNEMRREES